MRRDKKTEAAANGSSCFIGSYFGREKEECLFQAITFQYLEKNEECFLQTQKKQTGLFVFCFLITKITLPKGRQAQRTQRKMHEDTKKKIGIKTGS
jgi:hypothetical protein